MTGKAVDVMEGIKDIIECCICTEMFTDPRMLPCIHTFCLTCLEKTGSQSQKKPGDKMPCPLCRKEFIIPTDGFLGVQKNVFMERLMEMAKLSQPPDIIRYCDSCNTRESETNAEVPLAKMYCIECEENLCDDCINYHKRQKQLKTHQIVALRNQMINEKLIKRVASNICDQHTKYSLEMFCHDCRKVICVKCFEIDHKGHRCSDVEDVADKFRKQIEVNIEKVKTSYADGLKIRNKVDVEKRNFVKQVETAETEIIKRANELKHLVDKNMQLLLAHLVSRNAETLKTLQIQRDEIDIHLRILDSFKTYCSEMQDKGTPGDVCLAVDDLCSQSSELEQKHKYFTDRPMTSFSVIFEKTNLEGLLSERNIIGSFEDELLLSTELVGSLETGTKNSIWGVIYLKNLIYVLSKENKLILAFDAEVPFSLSAEIPVPEVAVPRHLAACEKHNCLYVVDNDKKYVWKVTCPEFKVTRWLTGIDKPFKISVTKEGRVLIPREGRPCAIELVGSDARLEKSIKLPDEIKDIQYAIQSPSRTFIVSYGRNWSMHRGILEISTEGHFLKTHCLPTEIWSNMRDPLHMTFGRDDRFFVTDCSNDRVIAFDSQLQVKQILLNKLENDISMPYRVCYIEDKKYLIVAHSSGYKVDVYKCS